MEKYWQNPEWRAWVQGNTGSQGTRLGLHGILNFNHLHFHHQQNVPKMYGYIAEGNECVLFVQWQLMRSLMHLYHRNCEWSCLLWFPGAESSSTVMPFNGINPRSVVLLNNASIHHTHRTIELIQSVGALVHFIPPYSPDLDPVEELFSKVKAFLKENDEAIQAAAWDYKLWHYPTQTTTHFIRGMEGEEEFQISFVQRVALHCTLDSLCNLHLIQWGHEIHPGSRDLTAFCYKLDHIQEAGILLLFATSWTRNSHLRYYLIHPGGNQGAHIYLIVHLCSHFEVLTAFWV